MKTIKEKQDCNIDEVELIKEKSEQYGVSEITDDTNATAYVKGYFVLENKQPNYAPEHLLDEPPRGKRYAEAFRDGIVCVQMEYTPHAKLILQILDASGIHYRAMLTRCYLRLFFSGEFGMSIYNGFIMTGKLLRKSVIG